jgi:FMN-dependent oxidoreductase (nitrilotriacetate monooxygenase family)
MFGLGWFLGNGYGAQPWNTQSWDGQWNGTNGADWAKPDLYVDLAKSLDRACFDFLFIEDTSMIEDTYGGSMEWSLKNARMAPKNDPLPLVPLMTQATKHLGVIATMSTVAYHPYLAARAMTTLDHLTEGRVGINVVTSVTDRVAQNFGLDQHHEHDLRYEMAEEWMDLVSALWESWDEGAVVRDESTGTFTDFRKVHTVDFRGKYFSSRGPLNTAPGPQRRPVVAQAGNSAPGRDLAAKHADTMLAHASSVESMKAFRDDMHERLLAHGRKPSDCKIFYVARPTIADSDEAAAERDRLAQLHANDPVAIERRLWNLSYISGGRVDFGKFDLDEPISEVLGNGEQSTLATFYEQNKGKTLREAVTQSQPEGWRLGLTGSPDTVAARMGEVMDEVGGDGFLLYPDVNRRAISEVTEGLVPALQRRGLMRSSYEAGTFRDRLTAP